MIDANNGQLSVNADCVVSGALKKSVFMSSSLFHSAKALVINPPFASYAIPDQKIDGRTYTISFWFDGESLWRAEFTDAGTEFGGSWNDWSEENERKRKEQHDRLLGTLLGSSSARVFAWGQVESVFDLKSGSSSIIITYKQPIQPLLPTSGLRPAAADL